MMPDELVDLGEFGTALFEPIGKPLSTWARASFGSES
jgi:hypothetical protein